MNIKVCVFILDIDTKNLVFVLVESNYTDDKCEHGGTSYVNVGIDVCICPPGYTGDKCENNIDDCLSSPCLHGGNCTDQVDNYTCDCSDTFYEGPDCDTRKRSLRFRETNWMMRNVCFFS